MTPTTQPQQGNIPPLRALGYEPGLPMSAGPTPGSRHALRPPLVACIPGGQPDTVGCRPAGGMHKPYSSSSRHCPPAECACGDTGSCHASTTPRR